MKKQKTAKVLLPAMMVLSWLAIPLLGKKEIKRYLPASILMAIIVCLESILARKRNGGDIMLRSIQSYQAVFL